MISDKDTNIVFFSKLFKEDSRFSGTCSQITNLLDSFDIKFKWLPDTKDIWARDYMPVQVSENKFIEFRYDPDYLQGTGNEERNIKTYPDIVCDRIDQRTIKSDIILDGGNVVKSSNAVILTDKIVKENERIYNKDQLIEKLKVLFETDKIILIPWDTEDDYGHSDGMVRFIDENTVLLNYVYLSDNYFKRKLLQPLKMNRLNCEWLKFNVKKEDKRNWAYLNFLQTKDLILVPKLNIDEDVQAFEQIKYYYPDYDRNNRILQVDMTKIVELGGALNCVTWSIKGR